MNIILSKKNLGLVPEVLIFIENFHFFLFFAFQSLFCFLMGSLMTLAYSFCYLQFYFVCN